MKTTSPAALPGEKSHYLILDGLRGVAAITVVAFHTFEAYAEGSVFKQHLNHGYMAVDFFFLLSGFVIAYAYDDRWSRMTQWEFYKRRLIRLQPMVIVGNIIGAALFYFQKCPEFFLVAHTPVWKMLLVMLLGFTMLPLPTQLDIRGWDEMHPLDGPAWSLFYEYLANIAYALGLRKLSQRALSVLVVLSALFLIHLLVFGPRGDVIGGWAVNATQLHIGFARLLFPFLAGMLLMRSGRRIRIPHAFLVSSVLLLIGLCVPRFGTPHTLWVNGLYESFAIIVLFPLIVAIGAGEQLTQGPSVRVAKFLGELSYPLYITHYPLIYVYTAWVTRDHVPASTGAIVGTLMLFLAIAIAWTCLKLYDEPLRRYLAQRFLRRPA